MSKKVHDIETQKKMLCAEHGHPPVIEICMGEVTCARCSAILGDRLMGVYDTSEKAVIGHGCEKCHAIYDGMTKIQKKLTPRPEESTNETPK